MGERVAAMIFNGLGFTDSRLYMFPEFLEGHAIKKLFKNQNITAEMFNDDALGRCLDAIYEYGPTKFFFLIASSILKAMKLIGRFINIDTTSLTLYGRYEDEEEEDFFTTDPSQNAVPKHGYSKDNKPQFKQMILNLATTGAAGLPIYMESNSGNTSDKKSLCAAKLRMQKLLKDLKETDEILFVADSAAYDAVLENSHQLKWLTRVPETHKLARQHLNECSTNSEQWVELGKGYKQITKEVNYKGVHQRWAIIYSQQAYDREIKTLDKRLEEAKQKAENNLWHLSNEIFSCKKDAHKSIHKFNKKEKYYYAECRLEPVMKYAKPGKPVPNQEKIVVGYKIQGHIEPNKEAIEKEREKKGKFILATNEHNHKNLKDEEILSTYKAQANNERGFAFIKNKAFEVSSVFLKKPSRIAALMPIMVLCLMMYGICQYIMRQKLEEKDETLPNQLKKETKKPSMQYIFTKFRGVHLIKGYINGVLFVFMTNLNQLTKKIIQLFGPTAMRIYGLPISEAPG